MPDGDARGADRARRAWPAPGQDVSIVTYAAMLHVALEAAEAAAQRRDRRRGRGPADAAAAWTRRRSSASAAKTGKVIVLHEATRTGRPGGEVAALIAERAFEYLDAPIDARGAARHAGALLARRSRSTSCPTRRRSAKAIRALAVLSYLRACALVVD